MLPKKANYKYSLARIIIVQPGDDRRNPLKNCKFIKSDSGTERDHYIEFDNLDAGHYYVYCEITWNESSKQLPKQEISLNCYGSGYVKFSNDLADSHQQLEVLTHIFTAYTFQNIGKESLMRSNDFEWYGAPAIKEYNNVLNVAYYYFTLYINHE